MTNHELEARQTELWNRRGWDGNSGPPAADAQWLAVYGHIENCMIDCRHDYGMHCDCPCHVWARLQRVG